MNNRVWIGEFNSKSHLDKKIEEMASWLELAKKIPRNSRVVIKPNMTYPFYSKGVSTSPAVIEAVVRVLRKITNDVQR